MQGQQDQVRAWSAKEFQLCVFFAADCLAF